MINRLIQPHITGFSTDKKKLLTSGFNECMISVFEEMEQMIRHIETLEREVKDLKQIVESLQKNVDT